jgi:hypothetical protein
MSLQVSLLPRIMRSCERTVLVCVRSMCVLAHRMVDCLMFGNLSRANVLVLVVYSRSVS